MSACSVCTSPMLLSVVSMAESGSLVSEIADATGLDPLTIERHLTECCGPADSEQPDSLESSDRRLRDLSNRIGLAASVSGIQGDTKSHLSALSLALRVELEQRAAIIARTEAERAAPQDEDELVRVTVAGCDAMLRRALASPPRPGSAIFDYGWLMGLPSEVRALFQRISENPELLAAAKKLENNTHVQSSN